jgi:hypothetical protein
MAEDTLLMRINPGGTEGQAIGAKITFHSPLDSEDRLELLTLLRDETKKWWAEKCKAHPKKEIASGTKPR